MKIILEEHDLKTGALISEASLEDFDLDPDIVEEATWITKHWIEDGHSVYEDLKNHRLSKSTWHNHHPNL